MRTKLVTLITTSILIKSTTTYAQSLHRQFLPAAKIIPYALQVGYNKTTVLIFPAAISPGGIDRGSSGIIAKTVPGVENMLRVKANRKDFAETNLTVVTKDGKVYPFTVSYTDTPPTAPVDLRKQQQEDQVVSFSNNKLNTAQIDTLAKWVAGQAPFLHNKTKSYKVKLLLTGIFSYQDVLCFRFVIKNKSNIDYTIDLSRFYIRDKRRAKRTAQQEKEIKPRLIHFENGPRTPGKSVQVLIAIFPKFTIADHKNWVVHLTEKQGDRDLILKINGNQLVKAKPAILNIKNE